MNDDLALLREYAATDSEAAFATLATRHVSLVYSVALRQVRDPHLAQEITQAVFIILARKADKLSQHVVLPGWLCHTARYASAEALRNLRRRRQREQEAHMQSILASSSDAPSQQTEEAWNQIAPLLDAAMEKLGQKDHDAVVLRFFQNKNFAEVGAALDASEDAAKMRVSRALEKLRRFFTKRGIDSTAATLAETISANSVQAAPVALAKAVTAVAIAKGATASLSTLTLIKGALELMAWTKAKTTIALGVVAILAATSTTVIGIKVVSAHRAPPDTTVLTPVEMNALADIHSDGTILFQGTVEETNNTTRTASADSINDVQAISLVTDESGKPMKFTKRPGGGFYIFMNKPVPPGGKVSYTVEGTVAAGLIQSKGAGEYGVEFAASIGNVADAHLVQIWRLPLGATLLGKNRGMEEATNAGQIELRIDRTISPNGSYPVGFNYRLQAKAN